ncbi:hypothetical protein BD309DRAFT_986978 [Dichomitus squalens]|uniref:Uncharacterized protein n=1 Tax=Dichomitus squalens TaxID=114155 RepID=A0A4Q9P7H2_9APHY|nr:hypothetical protein BD309DRAFT_986978 [Dichomitus squalens]TBU58002.1 hypothetical protein BD310DRAFT_820489 [Dichomitus squalens]
METFDPKGNSKATDDGFFMERVEMLYEQGLVDLRAFAEREHRPFEEVRRCMAELHCKFLFDVSSPQAVGTKDREELVHRVLKSVSQELESLETLTGAQSFFVIVNPHDQDDQGFLGGTVVGREFWRGHRGCGAPGAEAFKTQCLRVVPQLTTAAFGPTTRRTVSNANSRKKGPARELKTELYAGVRDALRAVSGVRNAEMKWTNHSKLSAYGVRLDGWPDGVPAQNPSTLSVAQNKLLLDLLHEGKLYFSRLEGRPIPDINGGEDEKLSDRDEDAMFEDSIDYTWGSGEAKGNSSESLFMVSSLRGLCIIR